MCRACLWRATARITFTGRPSRPRARVARRRLTRKDFWRRRISDVASGKKWRGFGNFVPEFFIDAKARVVKILCSVYNFIWKQKNMAVKVAINGFGRIGRLVFRALVEQGMVGKDIEVVAVGDIVPADNLAYLVKYDSIQGRFKGEVSSKKSAPDKAEDDVLVVNGKEIKVVSAKSPAELPWKALGIDLVIESTGLFTDVEKAQGHITAGAKKVIISAPAKGDCL